MKVEERLLQKKEEVEEELRRILSRQENPLFQTMRHAVFSGGKRFRPLLVLSAGKCFGVSQDVTMPFACALELIHNYSLIHDDLPTMDNDDFRRGKPSCHKAFGEDIALLAGDGLLTLAFEVMAGARLEGKLQPKKEQVIAEISRLAGIEGMIGGQLMDITLTPLETTEESFYELASRKTGALIIASVKIGAILGEASASQLEAVVDYGRKVGLAFQIRDDILDSTQEERQDTPFRPNAVLLFGLEDSKRRLRDFVQAADQALDEASLDSEELRYLASKLLEFKDRKKNE
jgi:geranylgeranyl diphosphate synthase type II